MKKQFIINKTRIFLFVFCNILFISVLLGCDKDDSNNERVTTLTIGPKTGKTGILFGSPGYLLDCMFIKDERTNETECTYLTRIEGFEYEVGFEYRVKVLITKLKNPPMDGHDEEYKLLEVISKVKSSE
jgi:hypothetical protein